MATATYAVRRNQNLAREKATFKLGSVSMGFVTVAIISVLALLYLNQVTKTGILGIQVTNLQTQESAIATDKENLEVQVARLQSLQQIQASSAVAKMTTPQSSQVSYAN